MLNKLARSRVSRAADLYGKLMASWGLRPDRRRVTVKVNEADLRLLESLGLRNGILGRDVLESGWLAIYQHPRKKRLGVLVHTKNKPAKRRTFKVSKGNQRLVAIKVARIGSKEAKLMARKKKAVEEDEIDELEGLEDIDDLEDEDLEDEEPDDEDEEDEEEEEPAPKRSRKKTPAKKAPAKKTSRRKKAEPEDEDEEDEDEEPAPKKRSSKKTSSSKKSSSKSSNGAKGNNLPTTRELPKGQLGPQDIAELVGGDCDARYVRIFLRDSEDYEREDGSRWAFSKTEARGLVKEIKAARKAAGAA